MSDSNHVLNADSIIFEYDSSKPILRSVNLDARSGQFTCILGPNGSGKTTLLRCLLGQLAPTSGSIVLDGKAVGQYSPRDLARLLAYVPQFPESAFAFTVRQIVLMGRFAHTGALGLAGADDRSIVNEAMKMTETLEFAGRTLDELSGGEAQRVMIARALAQQPGVMLLDEPTSHLDIKNQLLIYRMMRRLADDWKMAVICVSHDINLAGRFADQLVMMRNGKVISAGTSEQIMHENILRQVYDVEVELIKTSDQSVPIVRAK